MLQQDINEDINELLSRLGNSLDTFFLGLNGGPLCPSKWFTTNENSKPKIEITLCKDSTLASSRSWVYAFISGATIPSAVVVDYMYHVLGTIKDELKDPWKSYGITIPIGLITPLDLLNVSITENTGDTIEVDRPKIFNTQKNDIYLLIMLVGLYKYAETHEKGKPHILEQIKRSASPYLPSFDCIRSPNTNHVHELSYNLNFKKLAAALDMFLEKFPENEFEKVRIVTSFFKYQECAAIKDLIYFAEIMGVEGIFNAIEWFFTATIQREVKAMVMTEPAEEIEIKHSYFPYMMALGLSSRSRSPYSASRNPGVHLVVHIVGSLLNIPRSINAMMVNIGNNIIVGQHSLNAGIIFLAHKNLLKLDEKNMTGGGLDEIKKLTPKQCIEEFKGRSFKFSLAEKRYFENAIATIPEPRPNTIGAWVKTNFLSQLSFEEA
ncbi:uncharacterized protein LOC129914638 [Episyrphus balteatus]|uniref:uncharacterized protein LOC129914638 n=1 Tax=Episyrphus balteatus TaxID=286459 RepID=UPI00248600B3|nr:uncharacterized protein LOC129914638 [Episyrphus balteatus]